MDIKLSFELLTMPLLRPFRSARREMTETNNVLVRLHWKDMEGLGEAAPTSYHGENVDTVSALLQAWQKSNILGDDPFAIAEIVKKLDQSIHGHTSAKAAVEMALYDLCGKIAGQPTYKMLGLSGSILPMTSFSISIDSLDKMKQGIEAALSAGHKILKIKQGTQHDKEIITFVRKLAPNVAIRVDANCAWTVKEAIAMSHFLADHQIEFFEQPLPMNASYEDCLLVREQSRLPIFLDESICVSADVSRFADAADGIVLKLTKTGGLFEALKVIFTARSHGMKILLGCMFESAIGITAAAHLGGLVDYLDLDGNLHLAKDPFSGVKYSNGHLKLPEKPGLGVVPHH